MGTNMKYYSALWGACDKRLAELEAIAERATDRRWTVDVEGPAHLELFGRTIEILTSTWMQAQHAGIWSPAFVLGLVAQQREMLMAHVPHEYEDWPVKYGPPPVDCSTCTDGFPCDEITRLAKGIGVFFEENETE